MNFYKLDPFPVNLGSFCPACMNPGMGLLGAENCQSYLTNVDIYTRLSKKTDKKKETRARAAQMAADNQAAYNACVDRNATVAVQSAIAPVAAAAPAATTTASTVSTVANSLLQAATQAATQALPTPTSSAQVVNPVIGQDQSSTSSSVTSTGILTPKNLMIAGGVLVVGALIYFMMRKRS